MNQPFKCSRCRKEHVGECADVVELKQQIAALRKRIEDAPVVCYMGHYGDEIRDSGVIVYRDKESFRLHKDIHRIDPLIRKEDLLK